MKYADHTESLQTSVDTIRGFRMRKGEKEKN
jgi:hypothetical protein